MAILKCKMCGGDIELAADKTVGICECCGSTMTFPKLSDEQRADAFNRGNHFRRLGEFDKALEVYERIVQEEPDNAEAHWCCALSRFGIEYVEDPVTMEYVPTCHRASFDPFPQDVDCLAAIENADGVTKRQYQRDAAKIAEIQRGILATSQNEEPFDVFICYKETDERGQRTVDSTLAQDIYYQLTDAGLRVFFSRITLEDKVGSEYEPYIFAALHSAKAMVCVATKPDYLNAPWVRNEWSRYLALMRKDRSKVLLPCYRDMDPYKMPEELTVLQAYDMSKIGFLQDLIRGIKKITAADEPKPAVKETVVPAAPAAANVTALMDRGFMALEDGEWNKADGFFEDALNQDAKNAKCYLGKLMAELQIRKREDLKNAAQPFDKRSNYLKACRFDEKIAKELADVNVYIREQNKRAQKDAAYQAAVQAMNSAETEGEFKDAARQFTDIKGYKDADNKALACLEEAKAARKERETRLAEQAAEQAERMQSDLRKAIVLIAAVSGALTLLECFLAYQGASSMLLSSGCYVLSGGVIALAFKRLVRPHDLSIKTLPNKTRTMLYCALLLLASLVCFLSVMLGFESWTFLCLVLGAWSISALLLMKKHYEKTNGSKK